MSRTAETEQRVRHVVALRRAVEALPDGPEWRRVRRVERELRQALGVGVPKGVAARVLGISVTALDRWIQKGKIVEAHRPGSSRALVEAWSLVQVALEAGRAGEAGVTRGAVAEGIRQLEAAGRLPVPSRPNEHPLILRRDFLNSTPEERLAEGAELAYAGTWLAAQGARARRLRAVG